MEKISFSERLVRFSMVFFQYFVPVLAWMSVIFLLSSQSSLGTTGHPLSSFQFLLRKGAHVAEYFVLGVLLFRLFRFYFSRNSHAIAAGVVLSSLPFAISDEAHQLFVLGRQGRITDVGIDAIGIFFSLVFCFVILRRWEEKRN